MKHPILDHTASLRQQADRFGFECMSTEWRDRNEPHLFRCAAGHGFLLTASALEKKGSATARCAPDQRAPPGLVVPAMQKQVDDHEPEVEGAGQV